MCTYHAGASEVELSDREMDSQEQEEADKAKKKMETAVPSKYKIPAAGKKEESAKTRKKDAADSKKSPLQTKGKKGEVTS